MSQSERLKMLFKDGDAQLLNVNVGLGTRVEPPESAVKTVPSIATRVTRTTPTMPSIEDGGSDSDSEFEDEYLAALAASAKEARGKGKQKHVESNSSLPRVGGVGRIGDFPAQDAEATSQPGVEKYFCSAVVLSRFPYKYIPSDIADSVAQAFFSGGKFWSRQWDLPLLLVPQTQAQQLIDEINNRFNCKVAIPARPDMGVLLSFEGAGSPLPQFLGKSTSREIKDRLESSIPSRRGRFEPSTGSSDAMDRSFAMFKEKMEAAFDALRRKSKLSRFKKQREQKQRLQSWCRSLKRAECYLGLRRRIPRPSGQSDKDASISLEDERQAITANALADTTVIMPLNVRAASPFPFADEPIFISVDIESNEKAHNQIIEIGVSSLDTLDLVGIPPGKGGCNWMEKIKTRHFRISEYAHVRNADFIIGCPDRFEFGNSEWISIQRAAEHLESCFRPPYSGDIPFRTTEAVKHVEIVQLEESEEDEDGGVPLPIEFLTAKAPLNSEKRFIMISTPIRRNIVLVGHNLPSDLIYMTKLGCTIFKPNSTETDHYSNDKPHFLDSLDTDILFRVLKRERQPSSLSNVLLDLDLAAWNLHNAGNDAHYTMQALIGIVIRSRLEQEAVDAAAAADDDDNDDDSSSMGSKDAGVRMSGAVASGNQRRRERAWKAEIERRVAVSVEEAEARVREECALWDTVLGFKNEWVISEEDIDGGLPKGLAG
ncbi:hypothetical protein PRK78_000668 [Emydomyces testavorans]|uniref:Gfd2/YDR514C-like C-terminal domain-containing protein n=1 Tax=Emydomyces testavorans TaxID=2070801 RepID=A0AAF0DB53_9EURO|nr:hypothetical protein PRK78_000668 [Emydomyces testavorans]